MKTTASQDRFAERDWGASGWEAVAFEGKAHLEGEQGGEEEEGKVSRRTLNR